MDDPPRHPPGERPSLKAWREWIRATRTVEEADLAADAFVAAADPAAAADNHPTAWGVVGDVLKRHLATLDHTRDDVTAALLHLDQSAARLQMAHDKILAAEYAKIEARRSPPR